jgi:hypothetical protein
MNKDVEYTKFAEQNSCENAYHDVVQKNLKQYSLPTIQKLVNILKTEVDKSPLVKYNVGAAWGDVSAESHVNEVNPVEATTSYWNKNSWAHSMSADEVEVLRVSLGNTIL